MGKIHIWPETPAVIGETLIVSSVIEVPQNERRTLKFEVPQRFSSYLYKNCDPFVVGFLQILMRETHDVRVHGEVSPSLLQNLEEYSQARSLWRPELSPFDIQADIEKEPEFSGQRDQAVIAFSGGVDSGFTAFRHTKGIVHRRHRLTAGVIARGFDIPFADKEGFDRAANRAEVLLRSLGLDLIPMASNYRAVVGDHGYNMSWGTAVASCLIILQGGFSAGLLSQSVAYDDLRDLDWGCNPLTDRLLSSLSFDVVPDGADFSRIDKIRVLNEWAEFRELGRVCWQSPERDRNCCRCEKCIRTILGFRVLGFELPPCFCEDVSNEQIMALDRLTEKSMAGWYDSILDVARVRGLNEPWIRALSQRMTMNRKALRAEARKKWLVRLVKTPKRIAARAAKRIFPADHSQIGRLNR